MLCERCSYDEATGAEVPDLLADRYQNLCDTCAFELTVRQAKLED